MECESCFVGLVPVGIWRSWTSEQRRASGKKERAGEHCAACYLRLHRNGVLSRKTWKLEDLIEEAEFQLEGGFSPHAVAGQLGLKHVSLVRAYSRARRKGLTTRSLPYPPKRSAA